MANMYSIQPEKRFFHVDKILAYEKAYFFKNNSRF